MDEINKQTKTRQSAYLYLDICFSLHNFFSTMTWVAIPAWSHPGFQRHIFPDIRCHRVMASSTALVRACPKWSFPVTFGGGITIINTSFLLFLTASLIDPHLYSGLKNPKSKIRNNILLSDVSKLKVHACFF